MPTWKSVLKTLAIAVPVVAALWVLACAELYRTMCGPPEQFARVMSRVPEPYAFLVLPFSTLWAHARAGTLGIGDPAPGFTLEKLDKSGQIQLASFSAQNRPVALIFGSYT